jgi:hypothetical protein
MDVSYMTLLVKRRDQLWAKDEDQIKLLLASQGLGSIELANQLVGN